MPRNLIWRCPATKTPRDPLFMTGIWAIGTLPYVLAGLLSGAVVLAQAPARPKPIPAAVLVPARIHEPSAAELRRLPEIASFQEAPSEQFVIDWEQLRTGHPYRGRQAANPHTGCHVNFRPPADAHTPRQPEDYPAIYAIADGIVTRIDEALLLRPPAGSGNGTPPAHVRYGVDLAIARHHEQPVTFHYSIEPMVDPQDPTFYQRFILVKAGQPVKRGDVIARMYLPPDARTSQGSHIHFNLITNRQFQSPSVFSKTIAERFRACWTDRERELFPAAIGHGLEADENPYGTGPRKSL